MEVHSRHIEALDQQQLTELLRRLLHAEADSERLPSPYIHISDRLQAADQGEDGRIEWVGQPDHTRYLRRTLCVFQVKASTMGPTACADEVVRDGALNPAVAEIANKNGSYILFCHQVCNQAMIRKRVEKMKAAIDPLVGNGATDIAFYDANRVRDWVNEFPALAIWVLERSLGPLALPVKTWSSWAGNADVSGYEFVSDEVLDQHLGRIRATLREPGGAVRLVGASGLGKTRLAFEAFRPSGSPDEAALQASVVYCRAGNSLDDVKKSLAHLTASGRHTVLVVDDCVATLHSALLAIVQHPESKLSLLTIDYEPKRVQEGERMSLINVSPVSDEVIRGIIAQAYPTLSGNEIERVCRFAQGFPEVAVRLGNAFLAHEEDLTVVTDDLLVERAIWGRDPPDREGGDVIRACAAFTTLNRETDFDEVASRFTETSAPRFREHVDSFVQRGSIQRRGRFIQVQPRPLALKLAREKLEYITPEVFVSELTQMPERFVHAFVGCLVDLDQVVEAQTTARLLLASSRIAGRATSLNSEFGSAVFSSLVEVVPFDGVHLLQHEVGDWSVDDWLAVGPGRRNLVRALEKLCFRETTFEAAVRVLAKMAAAETEPSIGNNATGTFRGLFHIVNSGTQAGPSERFNVAKELLASSDSREREVAVEALSTALDAGPHWRIIGAEWQGSGPALEEWRPHTEAEVEAYYLVALQMLVGAASRSDETGNLARTELFGCIRRLLSRGLANELQQAIESVPLDAEARAEVLRKFSESLYFDSQGWPPAYKKNVRGIYSALKPRTLDDEISLFVSGPSWDTHDPDSQYQENQASRSAEYAVEKAVELADRCIADERVEALVPGLSTGTHSNVHAFARQVGKAHPEPAKIVDLGIHGLELVDANPAFMHGLLSGVSEREAAIAARALDEIASTPSIAAFIPYLTTSVKIQPLDLERVVVLLKGQVVEPAPVALLSYGRGLDHLPPEHLLPLLRELAANGPNGAWIALEVAMMYLHGNPHEDAELDRVIESLLLVDGLLAEKPPLGHNAHAWEVLAKRAVRNGHADLARNLAEAIVGSFKRDGEHYGKDHEVRSVLDALLDRWPDEVWGIIGDALLSDEASGWRLKYTIRSAFDENHDASIGFLKESFGHTLAWARQRGARAAALLVELVPVLEKSEEGGLDWSPQLKALVDEFGGDDLVPAALSHRLGNYSWTGSLVSYYARYVPLLEKWSHHQHGTIRAWAKLTLAHFREEIEREKQSDEERDFGIY